MGLLHVVLASRSAMSDHVIAVLPGDGTGKEVAVEAQRILDTIQEHTNHGFEQTVIPCGGQHYLATGDPKWPQIDQHLRLKSHQIARQYYLPIVENQSRLFPWY